MSKENTECDVRIALYDGSKTPIAHVKFFNDCELLLDCSRVSIVRDGNRLYFRNGDNTPGSVKLTQNDKSVLQLWKDYSKARDLEGDYDLKYDANSKQYYIDKKEKLGDYFHHIVRKGTKQLNHNPGEREKGVIKLAPVTIKEKGQKVVEVAQKKSEQNAVDVVVKALFELLKTQVKDNKDALFTISTLEQYII